MSKYAEGTSVPVSQSQAEIERTLKRYGADQYSSGWTAQRAVIVFRMHMRMIRIEVPIPLLETGVSSWQQKKGHFYAQAKVDAETRRRWRAMVLYLKAKLESVDSQIVSFEEAFMSHIILPDGQTVGGFMKPQIESAYKTGKMPPLLGHDG